MERRSSSDRVPQVMGPFGFLQHERNPYPDESTLLFWYDLKSDKLEAYNADWREQSHWVNTNIQNFRTGRERLERPWLAITAAYEAKCRELEFALKRLNKLQEATTV